MRKFIVHEVPSPSATFYNEWWGSSYPTVIEQVDPNGRWLTKAQVHRFALRVAINTDKRWINDKVLDDLLKELFPDPSESET